MLLSTDDKENDNDYSYDLQSCLNNYGIQLILMVKTTSTTIEATCVFLIQIFQYLSNQLML